MLLIISNNIFGQSQEDMQKWTAYMTPGDMHQMLAKTDGTWNEDMTMWSDPNAAPMKMTATCENKMIFGGRYQESRHTGNFNNMPFEGYNLIGYDNIKKVFQSTWIDNMGTGIMFSEGDYDPATKTFTYTSEMEPMPGMKSQVREVLKMTDTNHMMLEWYENQGGGEKKTMEIAYTRKK